MKLMTAILDLLDDLNKDYEAVRVEVHREGEDVYILSVRLTHDHQRYGSQFRFSRILTPVDFEDAIRELSPIIRRYMRHANDWDDVETYGPS